jgi:hypothetical protein
MEHAELLGLVSHSLLFSFGSIKLGGKLRKRLSQELLSSQAMQLTPLGKEFVEERVSQNLTLMAKILLSLMTMATVITMNKQMKWRGKTYSFVILHSGLSAVTEIRHFFIICSVIGKLTRETNVATPLSPTPSALLYLDYHSRCQSMPTAW